MPVFVILNRLLRQAQFFKVHRRRRVVKRLLRISLLIAVAGVGAAVEADTHGVRLPARQRLVLRRLGARSGIIAARIGC